MGSLRNSTRYKAYYYTVWGFPTFYGRENDRDVFEQCDEQISLRLANPLFRHLVERWKIPCGNRCVMEIRRTAFVLNYEFVIYFFNAARSTRTVLQATHEKYSRRITLVTVLMILLQLKQSL